MAILHFPVVEFEIPEFKVESGNVPTHVKVSISKVYILDSQEPNLILFKIHSYSTYNVGSGNVSEEYIYSNNTIVVPYTEEMWNFATQLLSTCGRYITTVENTYREGRIVTLGYTVDAKGLGCLKEQLKMLKPKVRGYTEVRKFVDGIGRRLEWCLPAKNKMEVCFVVLDKNRGALIFAKGGRLYKDYDFGFGKGVIIYVDLDKTPEEIINMASAYALAVA